MRRFRLTVLSLLFAGSAAACAATPAPPAAPEGAAAASRTRPEGDPTMTGERIVRSEEEWKRILTPEQYRVLRERGTERAFTGLYHDHHEDGVYRCAACGQVVFDAKTKFDSGTGWPSFWQPADERSVGLEEDRGWLMVRTEVHCSRCGSHLGHVFEDGPAPTGLRYCINSVALDFTARQ